MRRSGGFAGRTTHVQLDSAQLPPAEAARLTQLVAPLDLTRLPDHPTPTPAGADLMRYDLSIEHAGRRWQGTLTDPAIPAELRPLLQFLSSAAG
jgi:emfourin